jgi:hypothetical protein
MWTTAKARNYTNIDPFCALTLQENSWCGIPTRRKEDTRARRVEKMKQMLSVGEGD